MFKSVLLAATILALPAYAADPGVSNPMVPAATARTTQTFSDEARKLAFPTAEGYGRFADPDIGPGQAFQVMKISNLNDSGVGSFRACWMATGPRVCVVTVSGTIPLTSDVLARGPQSNVYLAGQTSPGGIQIKLNGNAVASPLRSNGMNDVIVRFIKLRPGVDHVPGENGQGVSIGGPYTTARAAVAQPEGHDIILDHISEQWATDEGVAMVGVDRATLQWSIQSEPLACSPCRVDRNPGHDYGMFLVSNGSFTMYKNLLSGARIRNPNIAADHLDMIGNVAYNYGNYAAMFFVNIKVSIRANIVGNWYSRGPRLELMQETGKKAQCLFASNEGTPGPGLGFEFYIQGNVCAHDLTGLANTPILYQKGVLRTPAGATGVLFPTPRNGGSSVSSVPTAQQAVADVLMFAGATADRFSTPRHDAVDARVIGQIRNCANRSYQPAPNTASLKTVPAPGYPNLTLGTTWAWNDSDNDGMQDSWELGTSGSLALVPNGDNDADGWSNIEEFLNYAAGDDKDYVGSGPIPVANCGYPAQ